MTLAIIQARMGSSRLPEKILKPLANRPALWHIVNRLTHSKNIDKVVIATTVDPKDDPVEQFCADNNIPCYRGSEDDVLDRYYQCAKLYKGDNIIRITGDCPVIDPVIVDEMMDHYFKEGYDLYGLGGEFPDGLDCTVFNFKTVEQTWNNAKLPSEREHVCPYMENHPEIFKIGSYKKFKGLSHLRWTLDEENDYEFLTIVYDRLYNEDKLFLTKDILDLLQKEPDLLKINSDIIRNEGYLKSLDKDKNYLKGLKE